LDVPITVAALNSLERDAREGEQGSRANALWRIGLLGNRGVEPDRAFEILMSAIHDENVNVRYWAVEGLAYLGTDRTIAPLLGIFHDDSSPMIRERAACSLAQSGMLSARLRLTAVPPLLDFAEDPTLDERTREWVFQALRDITGQNLPRSGAAWRDWYLRWLRR
jgi:HEAT repeat protein